METTAEVKRVIISDLIIEMVAGVAVFMVIGKVSGYAIAPMMFFGGIYGAMSYWLFVGLCRNFGSILFDELDEMPERMEIGSAIVALALPIVVIAIIGIVLAVAFVAYLGSAFLPLLLTKK